ncbi:hypothetical protein KPH14_012406 [Odynerus spinipes]|uniref:N-acetyltransferase ESCO1 n=1 Tax=Odynerus spinipes TaxID=1348599 RepID=A0AAD9VMP9_9HYME|nr:hypothetical protein KPH14_012406 [Odynerus spinipes]
MRIYTSEYSMKATCFNGPLKRRQGSLTRNMSHKYLYKRRKWSGINAGVFHKIRKPKLKMNKETDKEVSEVMSNVTHKSIDKENKDLQVGAAKQKDKANTTTEMITEIVPEVDPNKRFFRTNRTIQYNVATITVNSKVKLKVTNGKIVRNEKKNPLSKSLPKQPKPMDLLLDGATDLTVDEPEVEALIKESNMADILKVLEDDWADDEYDTMGKLLPGDTKNPTSPLKSIMLPNNIEKSPVNELSNLTSSITIKDVSFDENIENLPPIVQNFDALTEVENERKEKYYPLFHKGYTMNNTESNIIKSTPNTRKTVKWQLSAKGGGGENQYQLDAGQKRFGATQCSECGIVYQLGDPEDENAHLNYHNSIKVLKFQGWKNERIIAEDPLTSSRIILIEPEDPKQYWKRVLDILAVVDRDLGLADATLPNYSDKKVYLYIREKTVLGVLVAEYIKTAHRMIPELIDLDCCTAESTPAKCGINVVWTAMSHRKQGIATKLVDTLRAQFFYGYIMSMDDLAFSIPTPSGKLFAEKYTKTKSFKVYN